MKLTQDEVMQYIQETDVKFIRLAFCDVFGRQKNVAIMPGELERAFQYGIAVDASSIPGFGGALRSDLFLHPDPSTLTALPWRPQTGRVVQMLCSVTNPDGSPFEADTRALLRRWVEAAEREGYSFSIGLEMEFYLFRLDEGGEPTTIPCDRAGYMDIAPEDKGENVRREICLTLEQMGMKPECSHHESGPGQNEIDFRYADPLTAADNAILFRTVVRTIAAQHGLWADFSPRPLPDHDGSGMHLNISLKSREGESLLPQIIAGILDKIREMTVFLNPVENSYQRLGRDKAPGRISWSAENRSQLIRIPAAQGEYRRAELRSPDSMANPYLAIALVLYAVIDGAEEGLSLPEPVDSLEPEGREGIEKLPGTLEEAKALAAKSAFLKKHIPDMILNAYCRR
jgi:glutamine synthetase